MKIAFRLSTSLAVLALLALPRPGSAQDDPPFDPTGWSDGGDYPLVGDPAAKRVDGSRFLMVWTEYPPTLRTEGPNSNLVQTTTIHNLMWETLVSVHLETGEFIPYLASHWKIETDRENKTQTFWFRINAKARWADGSPVTAEDVRATWKHRTNEDRVDPSSVMTFSDYEEPVVVDRLTLKVKTKELNWRQFLYFGAGMQIYPAKECGLTGKDYLENWNWKLWMPSGPYSLRDQDIVKGESLVLRRRNDWWGENERWGKHTYNFDQVKFTVVSDQELQYEKLKKGDLDWLSINRAQRWVEEMPKENVIQKGWVKRRKIYNEGPQGISGLAMNMREKPFDDKRVRLAFAHLFNREKLMEKLFFNEYEYLDTYHPGGGWGADNERVKFDPDRAEELLEEAGYKSRDSDGFLIGPDGKRFELTLELTHPVLERIFLLVKEDFEAAGVKFNLKVADFSSVVKKISERQFRIHYQSWGGILFPNPETSWSARLADKPANNNITGFKNARVDELCEKYNETFDRAAQKKIIQEVDRIIFDEHPFALGWYAPYERIAYWDKYGHPASYWQRLTQEPEDGMLLQWWIDPDKEKALQEARSSGSSLPPGEVVVKPWAKQ